MEVQPEAASAAAAWQGKASAKLPGTDAADAWSLVSDFFGLHRLMPSVVGTCRLVSCAKGQPGCVRYCASPPDAEKPIWAYEELLTFQPAARVFTYKVRDNNAGLKSFFVALKVLPAAEDAAGSELEWSFHSDPTDGWTEESTTAFLQNGLDDMARTVEEEALRLRAAAAAAAGATPPVVN